MNSDEIIKLYEMVRNKNCINDKKLIDKGFILRLLNAPGECFESDLMALDFLLSVARTVLKSSSDVIN